MKKISILPLEQFVDRLIKDKGVDNLDEEILTQLKNDLLTRVNDHVNATIIDKIPENQIDEFEKVLDSEDQLRIQNFLKENVLNLEQEISLVLINFKKLYLG